MVYHQIRTSFSINKIHRHQDIHPYLMNNHIKSNNHEWDKMETRISNLGFFINIDPGNYICEQFEHDLRTKIAKTNNISIKKIPKLKCKYSSPFL